MMQTLFHENKHTLKLAFPIIISHLGQVLLGLTDTLMIGRVGTVELAAVALMNILIHLVMVLAFGLSIAVTVQVSHAHGAGESGGGKSALFHGLTLSAILGTGVWIAMIFSTPWLQRIQQPPEVLAVLPDYLQWIAPSMALMMPVIVIKSFAEAQNRPWGVFWIQIGGVLLNIALNAVLIFGMYGVPALGLTGAGIATFIARLLTLGGLGFFVFRPRFLPPDPVRLRLAEYWDLLRLAAPITTQMLMEFGAFAVSALLIGQLGSLPMAAHQIALTCATASYMIPMGLSSAVGIRVGHAMGAGARERCRQILWGAQGTTVLIMGSFAALYLGAGRWTAAAFTPEPELITLAATLLSIAGVFQLFDGIQVVSVGALRAMKDVKVPTLLSMLGYWGVAFPFGVWLGFGLERGVTGFWTGLATGLGIAAFSMSLRLIWLLRKS
ncbi:MAG: MATE family efflux transporter [Kiritimatiellia bacterium]